MNREADSARLVVPAEQVELALTMIENSAAFRTSQRHRALLRHMVSRLLDDDLNALKESVLAVQVFGRPAGRFDPRSDTIVRVEARRLRARLSSYYRTDGKDTPIRIELPIGSYVPLIASREPARHEAAATRRARDLVERGEHYLREALSKATLENAVQRFDAALRESPDLASAHVGLGRAWLNLATGWHEPPAVASAHAAEALRRALELEPDNAIAYALLGAIEHQFERDWSKADRSFKRALALAPQQAFVHSAYGCHLLMHGSTDAAERELLLARRLDPQYVNTRIHLVNLRIRQGRLGDAEAEIAAMHDIAPDTISILGLRGAIALFGRDPHAAIGHYRRACEVAPNHPGCTIALAGAHAMAGEFDTADALVADALGRFDTTMISPYVLAIFATRRGDTDRAFAELDRALLDCDPNAMLLTEDPSFERLHGDPRWPALAALARKPRRS